MKTNLSWCRWACLVPVFFVAMTLGPEVIQFCFFHSKTLQDYYGAHMLTGQNILGSLSAGTSCFGVTLLPAWVAPKAKYLTAISAGVLSASFGLIYWALNSTRFGVPASYGVMIMSEGDIVGIVLGLASLYWLFLTRPASADFPSRAAEE